MLTRVKETKNYGKREVHSFPMYEKDLSKEVWMELHRFGAPVTFKEDVRESKGEKWIEYEISIPLTQDEWDRLNRRLGKLGIDEYSNEDEEDD